MSCGNPHALPCTEAQLEATAWLDGELTDEHVHALIHHLEECAPCDAMVRLEKVIKGLVHRACHDAAPEELRQRVVARIEHVTVTITHSEIQGVNIVFEQD
jgi:mycothiol system anti-sigma-R factor